MRDSLKFRVIGFGGLALVLGMGAYLSNTTARASEGDVVKLMGRRVSPEIARERALEKNFQNRESGVFFQGRLRNDLEKFGVKKLSEEQLRQPNWFRRTVKTPKVLKSGKRITTPHLSILAGVQKVEYIREGASIKARHSVAIIKNIGSKPVAYFAVIQSAARGECKVRGSRVHNVMALMPGEKAEIVVCAGSGPIRINDLREMELTKLGYYYISQVPPLAVGYDLTTIRSHRPSAARIEMCADVPATKIREGILSGKIAWEDVVDFYSRHNCERNQFVPGYRLQKTALKILPYEVQ